MVGSGPEVVCTGIVVADIFPPPLERLPRAGELLKVDDIRVHIGGCAANCAVDLARLGLRAAVCARVGRDPFGDLVSRLLVDEGVDINLLRHDEQVGTSITMMLPVVGEDRRFIHTFGANARFGPDDVDRKSVVGARVLYVGGWFGLPGFSSAGLLDLLALAKSHGVLTVLDVIAPSGAPGADLSSGLEPVLPLVDYFLPNTDEAAILTGEQDPRLQAEYLLEAGAGTVAITLGAEGSLVRTRGKTIRSGVFSVEYVDGTGSGDAFDAGFIAGILEGWPLERTVAFASALAASSVRAIGTTTGVFTRAEAEAFMRQQRLPMEVQEGSNCS